MPSTSKKQHNFMEAIANNPAFAKKVGIKQSVGKDFAAADKGKKFKGGGMAKENTKDDMDQDKKLIKKAFGMHDKQLHENKKTNLTNLKKGGTAMAKETMGPKTMKDDVESGSNKLTKFGESAVQKRGKTKGTNLGDSGKDIGIEGGMKKGGKVKKMAGGGTASSRADGIASKGKTKGRFC
jgi:hypothetical protein